MAESTTSKETLFTKIIKREIPAHIVYEDVHTLAFLDIMPVEKGHTLVVPKKVYETIMEMPETEYLHLQSVVLKLAKHLEKKLKCGLNIWVNNKAIAGQEIPHVHVHLVPRTLQIPIQIPRTHTYAEGEIEKVAKDLRL